MAKQAKAPRRERRREQLVERKAERRARVHRGPTTALAVAFFLSGGAGLVHEVVWTRLLGHVFGVTEMAIATVLAAFMGGLAIGSWVAGRRAEATADPRRTYALLEIAIGLTALVLPLLLALIAPLYAWVWRQTHLSFTLLSVLRLVLAGALLLPPTIMMGATLPLLADDLARREGRRLAPEWLYTVNLLGAVLGVGLAGYVLMPTVGIWGTIIVGAALNIGVGLWVLTLPRSQAHVDAAPQKPTAAPDAPPAAAGLLLAVACLSGLLSLATQVAWTRVLALIVGSTTWAFTSVLLVYLVALGAGSAWASRRGAERIDVKPDLAVMLFGSALLTLAAVVAVNSLPYFYLHLYDVWGPRTAGGGVLRAMTTAFVTLFLPVACAGTILPLTLIGLRPRDAAGTAPAVGRVYAVNTFGAIVGSLLTGFVLIPTFGTQATLLGVAAVSGATGLVMALRSSDPPWLRPAAFVAMALLALGIVLRPAWNHADLHTGVAEPGRIASDALSGLSDPNERVLFVREGPTATVYVSELPDKSRVLIINARTNASDDPGDMATQILLAHVPLLIAPRPERLFAVGWGSGVTIGSLAQSPARSITAVEIEPAVVEGSAHFRHVNHDPLRDPRVRLHVDDARHILLAAEDTYDVIISEPPHPWVAGVSNLFTQDFYRLAERRLASDGLFVQWLQTYQISIDTYRAVLGTFQSVFPEVMVFHPPGGTDTILVGSRQPLTVDLATLAQRWAFPATRADLARIGMQAPEYLLATLLLGPAGAREVADGAQLNTDNNMFVEFRGPRDMERDVVESSQELFAVLEALAPPPESMLTDPAALLASPEHLRALVAGLKYAERPAAMIHRYEALAAGR
jgi:spermidine synthase